MGIIFLDLIGILCYRLWTDFTTLIAFEILHLRVVLVVFRFTQLRSIVIDQRTIKKAKKTRTLRKLTLLKTTGEHHERVEAVQEHPDPPTNNHDRSTILMTNALADTTKNSRPIAFH
jgi:hypothetical protein